MATKVLQNILTIRHKSVDDRTVCYGRRSAKYIGVALSPIDGVLGYYFYLLYLHYV